MRQGRRQYGVADSMSHTIGMSTNQTDLQMLKMKSKCEKCSEELPATGVAYICSFECTFCSDCTDSMQHVCTNCEGELLKRPARLRSPVQVAGSQLKQKLFGKS